MPYVTRRFTVEIEYWDDMKRERDLAPVGDEEWIARYLDTEDTLDYRTISIVASFPVTRSYGMVEGYYWDCDDAYCEPCAINREWFGFEDWTEPLAIFGDAETDSPTHCTECMSLIYQSLTSYGVSYVVEALREYVEWYIVANSPRYRARGVNPGYRGSSEILDQWAQHIENYSLSTMESTYLEAYFEVRGVERRRGDQGE